MLIRSIYWNTCTLGRHGLVDTIRFDVEYRVPHKSRDFVFSNTKVCHCSFDVKINSAKTHAHQTTW